MDIHRPKAAQSWREFLIEIGTIICGILIALGLEQAVETYHTHREVTEAREAIHAEMIQNLNVAAVWTREHPCWLGAVDAATAWAGAVGPRPTYPTGLMINYQSAVWDMTKTGAVTHMPMDEQLALARFYNEVATDTAVINNHRAMATEIGGYLARDRLAPAQAADLEILAGRLRWTSRVEAENAKLILERGAGLNLAPSAASPDPGLDRRIAAFCATFDPKA